jgi:hypothetical protein
MWKQLRSCNASAFTLQGLARFERTSAAVSGSRGSNVHRAAGQDPSACHAVS